ncbi:SDR family NAD(P)-dependent oxidoreductase, partial [Stigmatella aurantiaca]
PHPFEALGLRVQRHLEPWPGGEEEPFTAGVSSFGFGGTNCHVVLQQWRPHEAELFALAADGETELQLRVQGILDSLEEPGAPLPLRALCQEAARYGEGTHRLAVTVRSRQELKQHLLSFWDGEPRAGQSCGEASPRRPVVFVFSGQGAQWPGMGWSLVWSEPAFRTALQRCDVLIRQQLGWSLLQELAAQGTRSRLDEAAVGWPATVALEIALAELWRSWGIEPDAVIGYSIGEVAAAHVAGSLDLEDALRVICSQARLIDRLRGQGAMALVSLSWEQAGQELAGFEGRVHRAISAAPDATVLTGEPQAITEVLESLQRRGISHWRVSTDVPAHSPGLASLRDELSEALQGLHPGRAKQPLASAVTGALLQGESLDAAYWTRHFIQPVQFSQALEALAERMPDACFVELGPHATLKRSIESVLAHAGRPTRVLASLRRREDGRAVMRDALGALYAQGRTVRWSAVSPSGQPEEPATGRNERRPRVLPLSARTPEALEALARAYQERMGPEGELRDVAFSAGAHRTHHEHRLAVVGDSPPEVHSALAAFLRGERPAGMFQGTASAGGHRRLAFVFSGQGSQWVGMGRQLLETEPVFRHTVEACDALLRPLAGFSLLDELAASEEHSRLNQTAVTQPALFALQVALAKLWRSWGIQPDAVIGHSIGEVAAAQVAGALSLEDALRVVHHRSRLMQRATGFGKMVAVELPAHELTSFLEGVDGRVSLGAINDPLSAVLSGDPEAVDTVVARLEQRQVVYRRLRVDYAFHSPQMAPLQEELLQSLHGLRAERCEVPFYSTVSGERLEGPELGASYWARNIREPVRFADAVRSAIDDGHRLFLELGPHPVLGHNVLQCLEARGVEGHAIASMRRSQEEPRVLREAVAALYVRGCTIDWKQAAPLEARFVPLPSYPWQRQRYWVRTRPSAARPSLPGGHPLLGSPLSLAALRGARCWEQTLGTDTLPYLADHRVQGEIVVPGAAYLELGLAAAAAAYGTAPCMLETVSFQRMLALPPEQERTLQVVLTEKEAGQASFDVYSQRPGDTGSPWLHHATGLLRRADAIPRAESERVTPHALRQRLPEHWSASEHYQRMTAMGLEYGDCFQGVQELWRSADEALGRVRLPEAVAARVGGYHLHPALLDACIQVVMTLWTGARDGTSGETWVPVGIESLRLSQPPGQELWAFARRNPQGEPGEPVQTSDLLLLNDAGEVLVEVKGLKVQRLEGGVSARPPGEEWLYTLEWKRHEGASLEHGPEGTGAWLVLSDTTGTGQSLAELMQARGQRCVLVTAADRYAQLGPGRFQVNAAAPEDYRRVLKDAFGEAGGCRGLIHLWSLDTGGLEDLEPAQRLGSQSALYLAQAVVREGGRDTPRLWLVTQGAQAVSQGERVSVAQAPLWGFGRALSLEHPELQTTLVDVVADAPRAQAQALWAEMGAADGETQIAWRQGTRSVARLVRGTYGDTGAVLPSLHANATYLITGGLGGLGLTLAKWMVTRGARHLVLVGRGEPSPTARTVLRELEEAGATVVVERADVANRAQMAGVLGRIHHEQHPLKGLVHAAAVLDDGTMLELDAERFHRPMNAKGHGAWNLHTLTAGWELDFFVMYSSAASLLGFPGQSNYAAANAFMDALAWHRRGQGLPGLSINWGAFAEVGMAAAQSNRGERLRHRGVGSLKPEQGTAVLERLLAGSSAQVAVMQLEARQWLEFYPNASAPLWTVLLAEQAKTKSRESTSVRFREALSKAEPSQRGALVEEHLAEQIALVLRLEPSKIDRLRALGELGLDSLMSLELRNRLEAALGMKLSATLLFTYPNLASLAQHVVGRMEFPSEATVAPITASPGAVEGQAERLAEVEQMSDDEAEQLLLASLESLSTELLK